MKHKLWLLALLAASLPALATDFTTNCSSPPGQQQCNITFPTPMVQGDTLTVVNNTGAAFVTVEYVFSGSPASVSITAKGCGLGGNCGSTLNTYSSTSSGIASFSTSAAYPTIKFTVGTLTAGSTVSLTSSVLALGGGSGGSFTAAGDLTGNSSSQEVVGILNNALPALSSGFLNWSGAAWNFAAGAAGFAVTQAVIASGTTLTNADFSSTSSFGKLYTYQSNIADGTVHLPTAFPSNTGCVTVQNQSTNHTLTIDNPSSLMINGSNVTTAGMFMPASLGAGATYSATICSSGSALKMTQSAPPPTFACTSAESANTWTVSVPSANGCNHGTLASLTEDVTSIVWPVLAGQTMCGSITMDGTGGHNVTGWPAAFSSSPIIVQDAGVTTSFCGRWNMAGTSFILQPGTNGRTVVSTSHPAGTCQSTLATAACPVFDSGNNAQLIVSKSGGSVSSPDFVTVAPRSSPAIGAAGMNIPNNGTQTDSFNGCFIKVANDGTTGTTINTMACYTNSTPNAATCTHNVSSHLLGVCADNCGTTGSATIQVCGVATMKANASGFTVGHWVENDPVLDTGVAADAGAATPYGNVVAGSAITSTQQSLYGLALDTVAGGATGRVLLQMQIPPTCCVSPQALTVLTDAASVTVPFNNNKQVVGQVLTLVHTRATRAIKPATMQAGSRYYLELNGDGSACAGCAITLDSTNCTWVMPGASGAGSFSLTGGATSRDLLEWRYDGTYCIGALTLNLLP